MEEIENFKVCHGRDGVLWDFRVTQITQCLLIARLKTCQACQDHVRAKYYSHLLIKPSSFQADSVVSSEDYI